VETDKGIKPVRFSLGGTPYHGTLHLHEDDAGVVWHGVATILGCTLADLQPHTSIAVSLHDGRTGLGTFVGGTQKDESQPTDIRVSVSLLGSGKLMGPPGL
jgi:hypothetical protein